MAVNPDKLANILKAHPTKEAVLTAMQGQKVSMEEALAALSALTAPPAKTGELYAKVSEKGALSIYGLQRMPVTLYIEQWERAVPWLTANIEALSKLPGLQRLTPEQRAARRAIARDEAKAKAAA